MDNIDRVMKEADRLGFGVSYGKYRAAYPNGSGDVHPTAPKKKNAGTAICILQILRKGLCAESRKPGVLQ